MSGIKETLYIYPGSTVYKCSVCKEHSIPRTFKNGFPICSSCVKEAGLQPVSLKRSTELTSAEIAQVKADYHEVQRLARESQILEALRSVNANTNQLMELINLDRTRTLEVLRSLEEDGKICGLKRQGKSAIEWRIREEEPCSA
ncbi:hypothetical protein G7B40_041460 [Aetokthonos hydrillicola Thurmond2011]|jgi:hypothetical protein|uniref:Uncharacterized protein n=1 Tax=Aetokthonos hydrillicola Thurmond2011 TaxID=2712845 RepID=A0AAP5MEG8_9CYAN|nr:hypothetical protein [Aetokthonos hydrillicola]MBO3463075.1 hypothetical protein [Aetokthonos hydrillicola CCALA 1050]MDR9900934.1 hypothetical protein [Aetokthonos hydrillicola Thurmond2011]